MLAAYAELATTELGSVSDLSPPPEPSLSDPSGLVPVIPHLQYPFVMTTAGANVTEQDSLAEIAGCVNLIVDVPQDAIPEVPGLGIPDPTFGQMLLDTGLLADQIEQQEPRAQLDITQSVSQTIGQATANEVTVFASTPNSDDVLVITVSAESDSQ
jgi:hypothetical protein